MKKLQEAFLAGARDGALTWQRETGEPAPYGLDIWCGHAGCARLATVDAQHGFRCALCAEKYWVRDGHPCAACGVDKIGPVVCYEFIIYRRPEDGVRGREICSVPDSGTAEKHVLDLGERYGWVPGWSVPDVMLEA